MTEQDNHRKLWMGNQKTTWSLRRVLALIIAPVYWTLTADSAVNFVRNSFNSVKSFMGCYCYLLQQFKPTLASVIDKSPKLMLNRAEVHFCSSEVQRMVGIGSASLLYTIIQRLRLLEALPQHIYLKSPWVSTSSFSYRESWGGGWRGGKRERETEIERIILVVLYGLCPEWHTLLLPPVHLPNGHTYLKGKLGDTDVCPGGKINVLWIAIWSDSPTPSFFQGRELGLKEIQGHTVSKEKSRDTTETSWWSKKK